MPERWVDKIFQRMHGLYGSLWLDRYRTGQTDAQGLDIGLEHAKATWADELSGFRDKPEMIGHALQQLSARPLPPTLPEFLALCRQAPRPEPVALPEPRVSPDVAASRAAELRENALAVMGKKAGHGWALKILQDVADGVVVQGLSEQFAVEALRNLGKMNEAAEEYVRLDRPVWRRVTAEEAVKRGAQ